MQYSATLKLAMVLATGAIIATAGQSLAAGGMAHAHMGHVSTGWKDTPGGKGFLPIAIGEAKTAAQHAGLAAKKPGDLAWMQTHARHVMNALDPAMEANGPGMGYGLMKAAGGVAKHITIAAKSDDASKNVKAHATHVATSAKNTLARANGMIASANKILAAGNASDAAGHVNQMVKLAGQLLNGNDANGDGKITWQENEGGLDVAAKHMGLMAKGEG